MPGRQLILPILSSHLPHSFLRLSLASKAHNSSHTNMLRNNDGFIRTPFETFAVCGRSSVWIDSNVIFSARSMGIISAVSGGKYERLEKTFE